MAIIDEQFEFRKANALNFIQNQIIREKRDREKKNQQYTARFRSAFDALVQGDFAAAKKHCALLRRKSFQWLLYDEFTFYCKTCKTKLPKTEMLASAFGISEKEFEKFVVKVQKKLPVNRFAQKTYSEFAKFKSREQQYETLSIKNIAVCATMSAGKSTFVNALLGRDVLPARNEATTAKITSVYDKDGAEKMVGYATKDGNIVEQSADATLEVIDRWNGSPDVERIFLQDDLDNIGNNGVIVAVHDTPGTNNSGDKTHHDVTMGFLNAHKMDALIFVANATQLCTTDEKALLKELHEKVTERQNSHTGSALFCLIYKRCAILKRILFYDI